MGFRFLLFPAKCSLNKLIRQWLFYLNNFQAYFALTGAWLSS